MKYISPKKIGELGRQSQTEKNKNTIVVLVKITDLWGGSILYKVLSVYTSY